MFTTRYIDEMMVSRLGSPFTLCERLKLRPNEHQSVFLEKVARCESVIEAVYDQQDQFAKAAAVGLLWLILKEKATRGIVLSSSEERGRTFMAYLRALTSLADPVIASVTSFPRWNVLKIGAELGWEIRLIPNRAAIALELGSVSQFGLILGAKSSVPDFEETEKALEESLVHPNRVLIRLW